MKLSAHIILVSLYCLVTVGMTVSTHFCGGVPVATGFGRADAAEPDWCCGEDEPDAGCCTTTVVSFVVTDDHTVAATPSLTRSADDQCVAMLPVRASQADGILTVAHPEGFSPGISPPLPILHRTLLI